MTTNLSRISQLKTPGFSFLYPSILASISGVANFGLLPPRTPGLMDPVSWYLNEKVVIVIVIVNDIAVIFID